MPPAKGGGMEICMKKELYTIEMANLLGKCYHGVLYTLNKQGHNPYPDAYMMYPYKCLMMLLPRAMSMGIPEELNNAISKLMNMIDVEDSDELLKAKMPNEFVLAFDRGFMDFKSVMPEGWKASR